MTGQEIKEIRKKLGMTQQEFAAELNIAYTTVNRWENGHTKPSKMAISWLNHLTEAKGVAVGGGGDSESNGVDPEQNQESPS